VPIDAPVARIWTCSVEVDAQTAPPRGSMEVALRRIASRDLFDSLPGDWHWKPSTFTEAHLTVEQGTTPGSLMIFVEYADIKPLKALLGN
jgi:hypothetical protein